MLPATGYFYKNRHVISVIAASIFLLLGTFYANTLRAAPTLTLYADSVDFSTLPTANEWTRSTGADVTASLSGGMWRLTRGALQESGWADEASLAPVARVNFGADAGSVIETRFTHNPAAELSYVRLHISDNDAGRYFELSCLSYPSHFDCVFQLRDSSNSRLWESARRTFTKGDFHTFRIETTGPRTIRYSIDGVEDVSQTFTAAEWNGMDWATLRWHVVGFPADGGNPTRTNVIDVSFDSVSYSTATDNAAPNITLGGATQNVWLSAASNVTVSALDGPTSSDGSGLKCLKAQWETPITGDDTGCYITSLAAQPVNQQGSHTLYLKAWDWAGNLASESAIYKLDTVAPTSPSSANSGCGASDGVWQNSCGDPNFSWSGAADGASGIAGYNVYFGSSATGTPSTFVAAASFNPSAVASGSTNYLRVQTVDNAGLTSAAATLFTLKYDNGPPPAPSMSSEPAYTAGSSNSVAWGSVSDSGGTGGVGGVEYQARRAANAACTAGTSDATWASATTKPFGGLASGVTYHFCVRARDSLGNTSAWSSSVSSTQDASAPGVPSLAAEPAYTQGGSNSVSWGSVADGGIGGVEYELAYANNSGFSGATSSGWQTGTSFNATSLTSCTTTYYRVRSRDGLGNVSSWSGVQSSTQDAAAPTGTLTIDSGSAWTTVGQVTLGLSANDDCVPSGQIEFQRQNESGGWEASWHPFVASSAWNLSGGDGPKTISVRFRDPAGNASVPEPAEGTEAPITKDSTAPVVPNPATSNAIFSPNGDGSQDETTISAAIVEANPDSWTIEIQNGSGTVIRSQSGTGTAVSWAWDGQDNSGATVADGSGYAVRIVATDAAGNSRTSASSSLAVDTQAPVLALTHPVRRDLWQPSETIPTNQNVMLIEGNVGSASDAVTVNGLAASVTGATNAFAQNATLIQGANIITVVATDRAGNPTTLTRNVVYDTSAPTLSSVSPNAPTQNNAPLILGSFENAGVGDGSGSAVDISQVRILRPGGVDVTASSVITSDGFSYAPNPPLLEGLNTFRVEMVDTAGNVGAFEWSFIVDRSAFVQIQQPATGSVLNDVSQTISGQSEANAALSLTINGTPSGNINADAGGTFVFPSQTLADNATSTLVVNATDALGNSAVTTSTVLVNSAQPGASINVAPNPFSNVTHFGLRASAPISASVASWSLIVGDQVITNNIGLPPASWTWDGVTPSGPLADGAYPVTLVVTATNNASTTATIATAPDLVRDTAPPVAPIILFPANGALTVEPSTLVTGTAEPNSVVMILNNGLFTFTAPADGSGLWQLVYPLEGGLNTLTATATDQAGHESAASAPVIVQVVVEPPLIDVGLTPGMAGPNMVVNLEALSRGAGHPDGPPTTSVNVTTPDGTIVNLTETSPGVEGIWTDVWTVDPATAFGPHVLTFEGVDTVGLVGRGKSTLFVDPVPPNAPRLEHPVGDVLVNLTQMPLVGKADPLDTIVISINGSVVPTLTVQADAQGNWQLIVPLLEGLNTIEVNARDLVGNLSVNGPVARTTRDTVPPEITGRAKETPIQTGPDLFFRALITDTSPVGLATVDLTTEGAEDTEGAGTTLPLIDFGTFWERVRLGNLPEATYPLTFWAQDAAGNTNTTTNTLTIDNTPPLVDRVLTLADTTNARIISDTVWFGEAANTLTVSVTTTDTLAGLAQLDFGDVSATSGFGQIYPYSGENVMTQSHVYAIDSAEALGATLVITATDLAANHGFADPVQLLRDVVSPTVPVFYLATAGNFVLLADNHTLVYGPQASGTLTVTLQARDSGIGLGQIAFSNIGFNGVDGSQQAGDGVTELTEFSHVYTIDGNQPVSTTFAVTVTDWVNNSNVITFTVIRDETPPQVTGQAVRPFIQSGNDLTFQAQITDTYPIAEASIAIALPEPAEGGLSVHDLVDTGNGWSATSPGDLPEAIYPLTFSATDQLGNTATATNTLIVADTDPTLTVDVTTVAPYGLVVTDTLYYGVGNGTYTITAQSSVPLPGLVSIDFGNGTGPGTMMPQNGAPSATVSHLYNFSPTSVFSNTVAITATDRADNFASVEIPIVRDSVPPSLTVVAQVKGLFIDVSWSATDELSGLDACALTVESAGTTADLSTDCAGSMSYPGVQDVGYVFTIAATDMVSNGSTGSASATPNGVTKYYYLGAERVAMRNGDEVFYLHGDHLGSTSLATDEGGEVVSETRYSPYGEERFASGTTTTDFGFTGQRAERGFGLMDYNARMYSPRLGRFTSADTIVPDLVNSQDWNRYAYVRNSPLVHSDPTGNCPQPSADSGRIICVAAFIPTAYSQGLGLKFTGDDRDFTPYGEEDESSRFWMWIDVDSGSIVNNDHHDNKGPYVHATCDTQSNCWDPLDSWNSIEVNRTDTGKIRVEYGVLCSHWTCYISPGPDGNILFETDANGGYTSYGYAEQFPNLEAYYYEDGELVNVILQMQNFSPQERQDDQISFTSGFEMAGGRARWETSNYQSYLAPPACSSQSGCEGPY